MEVGIDIVEIDRLKNVSDTFLDKVLTQAEKKIYQNYNEQRKLEFLAGRFACKEAIIKCLSEKEMPLMKDLEILNKDNGKPYIKYKDYKIKISISHEKHYAIAMAELGE